MADAYIIEAGDAPAGIAVREPGGFRFYASRHPFYRIENHVFRSLGALRTVLDGIPAGAAGDRDAEAHSLTHSSTQKENLS
jgi:hypothetical protein